MSVVTRFAPSPTGLLHIGGARTALFNWLFARHAGGQFLLRIEDTDRARSTQEAIDAILDGLNWLGLTPDAPPVYQFARAARHRDIAMEMVARGGAFRCYVTPEVLAARRADAESKQAAAKDETLPDAERARLKAEAAELLAPFRSPYRDGGPPPAPDAPFVIRLRAPDAGDIAIDDAVQGPVRVAARDIDDLVLLRADGGPTYMLAVVADDHDMGITQVIRGDDHLTNTARQIPIFTAMGWTPPAYAHIPLIHGQDGAKLSKRHGALSVQAYRDMGYLPEALCNYLLRLGWSRGDQELLTKEEAAPLFSLAGVNKAPSRLDFDKLNFVNAHHLRQADDARLGDLLMAHIAAHKEWPLSEAARARARAAVPHLKHRAKTLADLADQSFFLIRERPIQLDAAAQKVMKEETVVRLRRLFGVLEAAPSWEEPALAQGLKDFAAAEGVGMGQIGPGLRAVLSGGAPAPDLSWTMALLGRDEVLARIKDAVT